MNVTESEHLIDVEPKPDENLEASPGQNGSSEVNRACLELRPVWLDVFLNIGTVGFYTCLWFYRRTKEFNQCDHTEFKPVLWLLAPLFTPALIFALPRFVRTLNSIETRAGSPPWNAWHGLWYFLVITLSFLSDLADFYEFPEGSLTSMVIAWSLLFGVLGTRVRNARLTLTPPHRRVAYRLRLKDWLALVVGLYFFTFFVSFDLPGLFTNRIKRLQSNSAYTDQKNQFTLPITNQGWAIVELGTHSDGSAILELQGPLKDMYFMVFKNNPEQSVATVSSLRIESILDDDPDAQCSQIHFLSKKGDSVIARINCLSSLIGNPVNFQSTAIRTSTGIFELYGYLSSNKGSFEQYKNAFETMASGFEPK